MLLPDYTDFCGTPFAPPALPFQFQPGPKPSASIAKLGSGAIVADAAPRTITIQLSYANFHNTAVAIRDFPATPRLGLDEATTIAVAHAHDRFVTGGTDSMVRGAAGVWPRGQQRPSPSARMAPPYVPAIAPIPTIGGY